MPPNYVFHRVFASTPGDLELERQSFHDVLGTINEREGLSRSTLLVPVTCHGAALLGYFNEAVRQNVRACTGFIQVLGNSWGAPMADAESYFDLALACRDDAGMPTREVAVFLKDVQPDRCEPSVLRFRERARQIPNIRVVTYSDSASFESAMAEVLSEWLRKFASMSVGASA